MSFRESFNNFFRSEASHNSLRRLDDLTDYEFLFLTFEKRFNSVKDMSVLELNLLLHDLDATFSETPLGKDYFNFVRERDTLKSAENPPGEVGVDLGRVNILDNQISEMEKLSEFVQYKKLKSSIEDFLNNKSQDAQRVA